MSLARTLLNGGYDNGSIDIAGFECGPVACESYVLDAACEALVSDIYTVDKAYHTADIIGEVKVIKEGADAEALLEGMIASGIEKLKNAFKKFWAKIQSWFASVKKFFKSLFLQGKEFVKEFRKEITDKKVTGFKYRAYKYTLKDGDDTGDAVFKYIDGKINECAGGIAHGADASYDDLDKRLKKTASVATYKPDGGVDVSKDAKMMLDGKAVSPSEIKTGTDFIEEILKGVPKGKMPTKPTTSSELSEELAKAYRNGEDQEEDFEEFESNDRDEMLNLIESVDKQVRDFEKAENQFEKEVKAMIKALDGVKKDDGNEYAYKVAQKMSSRASSLLTLAKTPCDVKVAAYKEAANKFRSILGSFVRFKPAKEAMGDTDDEDVEEGCGGKKKCATESLLDMAYDMF